MCIRTFYKKKNKTIEKKKMYEIIGINNDNSIILFIHPKNVRRRKNNMETE